MQNKELITKANSLLIEMKHSGNLELGLAFASLIMKHITPDGKHFDYEQIQDFNVLDVIGNGNVKMESWFKPHPYLGGQFSAFQFFLDTDKKLEAKFYHLRNRIVKRIIAGGVQLTPNWEDAGPLTQNGEYKVGVDFFLTENSDGILMVVSLEGKLRVVEFTERLTTTQVNILEKISGAGDLPEEAAIHSTLWNALGMREVNKDFYEGVASFFDELLQHLTNNKKNAEDSKLFSSRLLGRLLFVWFLRKKNLINEGMDYFDPSQEDSSKYYNQRLKPLFFETLNTPVGDRGKSADLVTPYLNGGLFEIHENDWATESIKFPEGFFERLYEHFDNFNFTTDESSPEYEQVAIDPEMLGRVFESLLATQVTDTGESARKAKGAFYTPREVVSYMCKETLRQYLYTKLDNPVHNAGVDKLLDTTDADFAKAHSNFKRDLWGHDNVKIVVPKVMSALDEIKILDPACGSGAFPLGMVQLLTKTIERLDSRYDPFKTKLGIIKNSIFGVDIEPMAVEIAKLRTWLSLVVEENDPNNVVPLPNLDFKYVCADSLIALAPKSEGFKFDPELDLDLKLAEIRDAYFSTSSTNKKEKLRKTYNELTQTSFDDYSDVRTKQLKTFSPFNYSKPADFFDPQQMFGVEFFDSVIGNPPYKVLKGKGTEEILKHLREQPNYVYALGGNLNLYRHFIEKAFQMLDSKGHLCFIVPSSLIADKNTSGIRKLFKNEGSLKFLIEFPEKAKVFESVTQATTIFQVQKSISTEDFRLAIGLKSADLPPKENLHLNWSIIEKIFGEDLTLPLIKKQIELDLIQTLNLNAIPLKEITRCAVGEMDQTFQAKYMKSTPTKYLFLRGEHLSSYHADLSTSNSDRRWFDLQAASEPSNKHRLACQGVANMGLSRRLIFARIPKGVILGNSLNYVELPIDFDASVLLALLNSRVLNWYFKKQSTNNNVNIYELENLPIPKFSQTQQSTICGKVLEIENLYETENIDVLSRSLKIEELMNDLDQYIYSAYGLNSEEISIVESD